MSDELRYPIGRFTAPTAVTAADISRWIDEIAAAPARLREAVAGLDDGQLDTPYRPGGWTVRQVVHHLPDSHMNAYVRTCLALTEDTPTIKPYEEGEWARLPFQRTAPIAASLDLLDAVHARWVAVLRSMEERDFDRAYLHPASGRVPLKEQVALYAWHGKHHVAHITRLREREGW
ncbi:MAG: putative metal-dependent hydrolase [Gemmatimonadetes bacterium]|nr:putative metal-dependent hydrolase [Gemmatimonadota bacterium]